MTSPTGDEDFIVIEDESDSILPSISSNMMETMGRINDLKEKMEVSERTLTIDNYILRQQLAGNNDTFDHLESEFENLNLNGDTATGLTDIKTLTGELQMAQRTILKLQEEKRYLVAENAELSTRYQKDMNTLRETVDKENNPDIRDESDDEDLNGDNYKSLGLRGCLIENERLIREINELKEEKEEVERKMNEEKSEMRKELEAFTGKLQVIQDKLSPRPGLNGAAHVDVSALLDSHLLQVHNLEEEKNDLMSQMTIKKDEVTHLRIELENRELIIEEMRHNGATADEIEMKDREIGNLQKTVDELQAEIGHLRSRADAKKQEDSDIDMKNREINALKQRIDKLRGELEDRNREVRTILSKNQELVDEAKYIREDNARLSREHEVMLQDRREDVSRMERCEVEKREAIEDRDTYKFQAEQYKTDFDEERAERERMAGKLHSMEERLRMERRDQMYDRNPRPDLGAAAGLSSHQNRKTYTPESEPFVVIKKD